MLTRSKARVLRATRIAVPLVILVACAWVLSHKLPADLATQLPAQLAAISAWQWLAAGLLTLVSLFSVGQYDVLAHRHLRTELPERQARWTGSIGIAIGQTLGFGLVTGALARWRMLPALGPVGALRLSAFVSASFIVAWFFLTGIACLLLPAPEWTRWLAGLGLASLMIALPLMFWWPELRFRELHFRLPSLRLGASILCWAFVDTVAAAGALYVMLPSGALPIVTLYPLFLIAMGAALISNTPGGLGPFEVVLLMAMPTVGPETVMTAILSYRIMYYAVPAALATLALLRPFNVSAVVKQAPFTGLKQAPRSEVAAILQNGGRIQRSGASVLGLWSTGQTLTLVTDPVAGAVHAALAALCASARADGRLPMVYKSSARVAASARRLGWRTLHIADDAVLSLPAFSLDIPTRRTLRRKLRAATRAGVSVRSGGPLPHGQLLAIDTAWQQQHGHARGGIMGRYCPDYMVDQWVGLAYHDGVCIAFVTAHRGHSEWCLDMMRHGKDLPDGTMHMLVHAAVEAAEEAGAARFCLAATPACPNPASSFWRWAAMQVVARAGGPGLRQFKSAFGPDWEPRYAAARSWVALALGLADIARAIHNPAPLARQSSNELHEVDENYELASQRAA